MSLDREGVRSSENDCIDIEIVPAKDKITKDLEHRNKNSFI